MVALPPLGGGLGAWHRRFVALFEGAVHSPFPSPASSVAPSSPALSTASTAPDNEDVPTREPEHPPPPPSSHKYAHAPNFATRSGTLAWGNHDGDSGTIYFPNATLLNYGFEVGADYIVIPADCTARAKPGSPALLEFYDGNDFMFSLNFHLNLPDFMPPPTSTPPPFWGPDMTLSLTRHLPVADYDPNG